MWAGLHDRAVAKRVARRDELPDKPLIVSVGNLAVGGTGKTPVVIRLAQDLAARKRRGVVLIRGYKSPLAGPLTVTADNEQAGDEARLVAASLQKTGWSVVQARSRIAGLVSILASPKCPEVVVLEDGHQTARVARHLDIVILDRWRVNKLRNVVEPRTGPVFPWGPWRESATGATRAQIWLLETEAKVPSRSASGSLVLTFRRSFQVEAANEAGKDVGAPAKAVLVSGIARPEKFEAGALELLCESAPLAVRLADHSAYNVALVARIQREMAATGCRSLLTTAKDWIKLAQLWPTQVPAFTLAMEIIWGQNEALVAEVDKRL